MRRLVIIPCGKAKVWDKNPQLGAVAAKDAYSGPPFRINRAFAEKQGHEWLILSAKYGLIRPDTPIQGYNVTFKDRRTTPVAVALIEEQSRSLRLDHFDEIVVLGGVEYRDVLKAGLHEHANKLAFPFAGLPLGKAMAAVKRATLSPTTP